jgi:D-glucuronyl C5-epimerase C-terminus
VLVLGHHGRVRERNDPYLTGTSITPLPSGAIGSGPVADSGGGGGGGLGAAPVTAPVQKGSKGGSGSSGSGTTKSPGKKKNKPPAVTVRNTLAALLNAGTITAVQEQGALGAFNGALAAEKHLSGTRKAELTGVTETVHEIAAAHELTASRLPAIVATLNANRRWWTTGSLLASGARVEFAGSQLEWEYYPGQGIQLQVLGTFGKANGLYTAGAAHYPAMKQLLAEMIPLASQRAGGLAWEYYFNWDGGTPPWTSAMSQATGLEALSRAYQATKDPYYLHIAAEALPLFSQPPPEGVQVRTPRGVRFLQYTFAPGLSIINAFLQTLIGLDDYAQVSGNQTAATLFAEGNREAQWELPSFNTGAWSLYRPGDEDDLSYHELVTGFLDVLCSQLDTPVYCTTAQDFTADLKTPPALTDLTTHAKARRAFAFRFGLSKVSRVGITIARGSTTVFATSGDFVHGVGSFAVGKLAPGTYTVTLAATDLAGNFTRAPGTLTVTR